ncbi:MAG: TolC family outer membrane protein [Pseudomonadota bacterium]|nr:TolC family outer membrane protein [Pseudomonadota bacterium]
MKVLFILLLLLCIVSSPLYASDLNSIYQLARTNDAQILGSEASLEAAREAKPIARSGLLPQIFVSGAGTGITSRQNDSWNRTEAAIDLSQPLYDRGAYMGYKQADHIVDQAEAFYQGDEQTLIMRVSEAYFGVLAAEDNVTFSKAETRAILKQLDQATQRYDVGLIPITDVHESQARYDGARSAQILAETDLQNSREVLREIIGKDPGKLAKLKQKIPLVGPKPASIKHWNDTALKNNPDVIAAEEEVKIAEKEVEVIRSGHYPTADVVAGASTYNDSGRRDVFINNDDDARIGLRLNIPLYTGGRVTHSTRQARSRLRAARSGLEAAKRRVTRNSHDAYRGILSGISQVEALKATTVSTQSALAATQAGYEVGNRTLVDVLNSQRDVFRADSALAASRYEYVLNHLRLKDAAGTIKEADLQLVNRQLKH